MTVELCPYLSFRDNAREAMTHYQSVLGGELTLSTFREMGGMGLEEGELDERYSELARTLGGCPENVVGGRFRVVSILTTATQLSFVQELCNPTLDPDVKGAAVEKPPLGPALHCIGVRTAIRCSASTRTTEPPHPPHEQVRFSSR